MISSNLIRIFLCLSALMTGVFAFLFAFNPDVGLRLTNHNPDQLVSVMAGRYLGLTLFALVIAFFGDLTLMAAFFAIGTVLGFIDGFIYLSAGLPHWEHTVVGILAAIAFAITLWVKKTSVEA